MNEPNQIQSERLGLLSASAMPIAANCPGMKNLVDVVLASGQMPPETADAVRDQGIDIHAALETNSFDELAPDEKEVAARLKGLEESALSEWLAMAGGGEPEIIRETRLFARDKQTLKPVISAKVDFAATLPTSGLAVDYKSGYNDPTPSEVNWQCKTQAVCVWHENKHLTHIRAGIAASRLKDKLDLCDYDLNGLREAEWEIMRVVKASREPDAPRRAGHHCRWCPVKSFCAEHAAWLSVDLAPIKSVNQVDIVLAAQSLAPEALAKVWNKKKLIEVFVDAVDARIRAMTDEQRAAIGLKLEAGNKPRKITDTEKAVAALQAIGVDPIALLHSLTIPVGKVDAIVAHKFKLKKTDAPAKTAELLKDALVQTENKPSIVPL